MTRLYKLTDEHDRTRGPTQWGAVVSHRGTGDGNLCGPGWIHAYTHPLLALMFNPVHANIQSPHLWESDGEVARHDLGTKVGCLSLTTLWRLPLPQVSPQQRVNFGLLCAQRVYSDGVWGSWAQGRLAGSKEQLAGWDDYFPYYCYGDSAELLASMAAHHAVLAAQHADYLSLGRWAARKDQELSEIHAAEAASVAARAWHEIHPGGTLLDLIALAEQACAST